jgi:hypothetical protein
VAWPNFLTTPTILFGPIYGVRSGAKAQVLPLDSKPEQVFFKKKMLYHIATPSSIYQFRQPFANFFGGITHWYVTPPPIQLVFDMMLYIL